MSNVELRPQLPLLGSVFDIRHLILCGFAPGDGRRRAPTEQECHMFFARRGDCKDCGGIAT